MIDASEAFNARSYEPTEVARTFIPPYPQFTQLLGRNHSLVVGPRGSGKTTLLKMLQAPALETWSHADAADSRARAQYTGVFVPADRAWKEQLESVDLGLLDPATRSRFSHALFVVAVLRSLVEAMEYRVHGPPASPELVPHRRVNLRPKAETAIVRTISQTWELEPLVPTLCGLRESLTARSYRIRNLARLEGSRDPDGRAERVAAHPYLFIDLIGAATVAVEAFDDVASESGARWALLFDELELVPTTIRTQLLGALRSVDSRFIFKLSVGPFFADRSALETADSGMPGQDYDLVQLGYAKKEESYRFSRSLFSSIMRQRGLSDLRVEDIVGTSVFETPRDEWAEFGTAYHPASRLQQRFVDLYRSDRTFRAYINSRDIDVFHLDKYRGNVRAAEIRKITSIVAVRSSFRPPDSAKRSDARARRSRKNPDLYTGATALFAIAEGNPRWLIMVASALVDEYMRLRSRRRPLGPSAQGLEVAKASGRFMAFLRTLGAPGASAAQHPRDVLGLVEPLGTYFAQRVIDDPFRPEPAITFFVDRDVDEPTRKIVGDAMNAGAVVPVGNPEQRGVLPVLVGHRFRLSYLLAPHYSLPLSLGRAVALSNVLQPTRARHVAAAPERQLSFGIEGSAD